MAETWTRPGPDQVPAVTSNQGKTLYNVHPFCVKFPFPDSGHSLGGSQARLRLAGSGSGSESGAAVSSSSTLNSDGGFRARMQQQQQQQQQEPLVGLPAL